MQVYSDGLYATTLDKVHCTGWNNSEIRQLNIDKAIVQLLFYRGHWLLTGMEN